MKASVIVVNYNGGPEAVEAIAQLGADAMRSKADLVVVDNASQDGSDRLIESRVPTATLVRAHVNRGYASGVNAGLAEAGGDVLAVMNADVRPRDGALSELLRSTRDDGRFALVGGVLVDPNGRVTPDTARALPTPSDILREGFFLPACPSKFRAQVLRRVGHRGVAAVPAVSGAVMCLRREALELLGPMDENYFLYNEDAEWCRRVADKGQQVGVCTGAVFDHARGASTKKSERSAFAARLLSDFIYFCDGEGVPSERVARLWAVRLRFRAGLYGLDAKCGIIGGRPSSRSRADIYGELARRLRSFDWTPEGSGQRGHPSRLLSSASDPRRVGAGGGKELE